MGTNLGGQGGGLENHGISGQEVGGRWAVAEMEWKIERTDDQGGPAGAMSDLAGLGGIVGNLPGKKSFGVPDGEIDFGHKGTRFAPGFHDRLSDLAANSLGQVFLMGMEDFLGRAEKFDSFRKRGFGPTGGSGGSGGEDGFPDGGVDFREEIRKISGIGVSPG
jgi:hypothetical protein